jgi:hypothetical protein
METLVVAQEFELEGGLRCEWCVRQARDSTRRVIDERGKNAKSRSGHSAGLIDVTLIFLLLIV